MQIVSSGNDYVTCPPTCCTYFIRNKSLKINNLSKVKSVCNGMNYTLVLPPPPPPALLHVYTFCVGLCLCARRSFGDRTESPQPPLLTGITNFQIIKIKIPFILTWLSALKFVERRKSISFIYKIHIIARLAAHFTAPWALPPRGGGTTRRGTIR